MKNHNPEQKSDTPPAVLLKTAPKGLDRNVFQRIHAVMTELKTIAKNGRNEFHKYDYATEADFVQAVRPLLDQHGLVLNSQLLQMETKPIGEKGENLTTISMQFVLINVDKPEETCKYVVPGQGTDKGDKGVYKAITGAKKYFMALAFMAATGDDPENDGDGKLEKTTTRSPKANKSTTAPAQAASAQTDDF